MPRRLRLNRRVAMGPPRSAAGVSSVASAAGLLLLLAVAGVPAVRAASPLLESVKTNPALAKQMCARFKQLNAAGQSATSSASIAAVASAQSLSPTDAEILITYVIGLNCPDVR